MNKLLIALIAGAFATVAVAQTAAPKLTTKEKQEAVKSTTEAARAETTGAMTAKDAAIATKASREVAKMTRAEKEMWAKEINKQLLNPENPSGAVGTATMQKETTAASKAVAKDRPKLGTPEGQKSLEKAATK